MNGIRYTDSLSIPYLMKLIHSDILASSPDGPSLGEQLIIRILNNIFPEKEKRSIRKQRGSARREINNLRDMIRSQICTRLSLQDLAQSIGVSSRQLCRIFRSETGMSPHAYIMRCRVDQACALLSQGKFSLAETAASCGFSDQSHMTVTFQKILGFPPSDFRRC
jgi:AraC family transcriptional regulator